MKKVLCTLFDILILAIGFISLIFCLVVIALLSRKIEFDTYWWIILPCVILCIAVRLVTPRVVDYCMSAEEWALESIILAGMLMNGIGLVVLVSLFYEHFVNGYKFSSIHLDGQAFICRTSFIVGVIFLTIGLTIKVKMEE